MHINIGSFLCCTFQNVKRNGIIAVFLAVIGNTAFAQSACQVRIFSPDEENAIAAIVRDINSISSINHEIAAKSRATLVRLVLTRWELLGTAAPDISDGTLVTNLLDLAANTSGETASALERSCSQVNELITAETIPVPALNMVSHEVGSAGTIAGLNGAKNSKLYFKVNVPHGITDLVIQTNGTEGDADLYVSQGARPTKNAAQCYSMGFGLNEQCRFDTPDGGAYYILLNGYADYSDLTLKVSWRGRGTPLAEILTGHLYDSAVQGIQYRSCNSLNAVDCIEGITGLRGEFNYTAGQQIEFKLGGLRIGVAQGQELVTPDKLANGDAGVALQIAQLLQSLDEDRDPSNGIVIPESVRSLAVGEYPNGQDVRFVNNSQVLSKLAPGRALVSLEQVSAHAQGASLLDVMLANNSADIPKAILGTYAYPTTGKINFEVLNRDVHARLRLALFYRKSKQIDEILREHGDFFKRIENDTQAWANQVEGVKAMGDMFAALLSMDGNRATQAEAAISILTAAHSVVKVVDENYELNDGYLEGIKAAVLANSAIQGSDDFGRKMNLYRAIIEGVKSSASFKEDPVRKRLAEIAGMAGECVNAIGARASGDLEGVYQCAAANLELLSKSLVEYYNAGVLLLKIPKVEAHRAARDYLAAHYYSGGDRSYMREKYGIDAFARNYDASNVIGQGYNSLLQDDIYIGAVADGMAEIEREVSVYSKIFNLKFSDFLKLKASGIENGGVVPMGTAVDFEATFKNMTAGNYTVRSINWVASGVGSPTVVATGTRANVRFHSAGNYRVAAHAEVLLPDGQTYFMVDTFTVVVNDANVPNFTTSVTVNPIPVLEGNSVTIEIRTTPAAAFKQFQIRFWNNRFDTTDLVGWNDGVLVTDAQGIARGTYQAAKDCVAEGDEIDRFSVYLQNGTHALADGDLWIQDTSCAAPALTLAATPGNGYVDLSWNAIPGATAYKVHMATGVTGPEGLPAIATTSATQHRVSGLQNGTLHRFTVRAFKGEEVVVGSNLAGATPQGAGGELIAGRYLPIEGGSVIRDTETGLEWQRCSVGQTWNGATQHCDGTAATYNWDQAIQLTAAGGFRIPTIAELKTLVYCSSGQPKLFGPLDDFVSCSGNYSQPTVVQTAFPDTPSRGGVWSGSRYAGNSSLAWGVNIGRGDDGTAATATTMSSVRLMRGAPSSPSLIAGRYLPIEGGAVIRDTVNGLEWQRCSVGQTWNGATQRCDGVAATYNWDQAQLTAAGGFRIPTIAELKTLVYCSTGDPVLFGPIVSNREWCSDDASRPTLVEGAFPDTPRFVWSGTRVTDGRLGLAWLVDFLYGDADEEARGYEKAVRLVRGASSSATFFARKGSARAITPDTVAPLLANLIDYDGNPPNAAIRGVRPDATGRGAYFLSRATNLVPGVSNGVHHLFHFDASTGQIKNLGASTSGTPGDGDITAFDVALQAGKLVFRTKATNLESGPGLYLVDLHTGQREPLVTSGRGEKHDPEAERPAINAQGTWVAWDQPGAEGVWRVLGLDVADRSGQPPTLLSETAQVACCVRFDAEGRYLAWREAATDGRVVVSVLDYATGRHATVEWPAGVAPAPDTLRVEFAQGGRTLQWVRIGDVLQGEGAEAGNLLHQVNNPLFTPPERLQ